MSLETWDSSGEKKVESERGRKRGKKSRVGLLLRFVAPLFFSPTRSMREYGYLTSFFPPPLPCVSSLPRVWPAPTPTQTYEQRGRERKAWKLKGFLRQWNRIQTHHSLTHSSPTHNIYGRLSQLFFEKEKVFHFSARIYRLFQFSPRLVFCQDIPTDRQADRQAEGDTAGVWGRETVERSSSLNDTIKLNVLRPCLIKRQAPKKNSSPSTVEFFSSPPP